jgi:hypothetical protein
MRTTRKQADRGVLIVVAATLLVLAACDGGDEAPATVNPTPPEASAEKIATSFVEAYGAFDAEEAITYLAPDATILELIGSVGAHRGVQGTPEELPLLISLLGLLLCQAAAAIKSSVGRFVDVMVLNTTLERRRLSARIASVLLMPSERFLAM